jgi:hypothetical protein
MRRYPDKVSASFLKMAHEGYLPKMHLGGHGPSCRTVWNLNYAPGLGRADGEGPERAWALEGELATQTCEMGPGNRHATLDDHQGEGNYRRIIGLGTCSLSFVDLI